MNKQELILFLQKYLRIDTSHPKPAYDEAVALFKQQAQLDGFEAVEITLPSGKPVLVIVQRGANPSLPALALAHHMDVVPAGNITQWKHEPFVGTEENGIIYGRGAQDMKAVGVVHYAALQRLKQVGKKIERTVCLLLVPDEEIGGLTGVGQLVNTHEFSGLNIGYVLDEGIPSSNQKVLLIKVSERKPLQIKLTAQGTMAHGSRLFADNPVHKLVTVLEKFVKLHADNQTKATNLAPGLVLSTNITSLAAGSCKGGAVALNVVPDSATATVDIRVPPAMTLVEAEKLVEELVAQVAGVSYAIVASGIEFEQKACDADTFYKVIEQAILDCGFTVQQYNAEEATDLRFYLHQGMQGFGLTPFTCKENIHGIDESVSLSDLEQGCKVIYQILENFCLQGLYV